MAMTGQAPEVAPGWAPGLKGSGWPCGDSARSRPWAVPMMMRPSSDSLIMVTSWSPTPTSSVSMGPSTALRARPRQVPIHSVPWRSTSRVCTRGSGRPSSLPRWWVKRWVLTSKRSRPPLPPIHSVPSFSSAKVRTVLAAGAVSSADLPSRAQRSQRPVATSRRTRPLLPAATHIQPRGSGSMARTNCSGSSWPSGPLSG